MSEIASECRICGSRGPHDAYAVTELYHGTRESFEYFVCVHCATLQALQPLEGDDLARHYPRSYYSYHTSDQSPLLRWLIRQRDRFDLDDGGWPVGAAISKLPPGLRALIGSMDSSGDVIKMLGRLGVSRQSRILDIGCGGGALLDRLARLGFTQLAGADPFNEGEVVTPLGVVITKQFASEVAGEFDVIMFNHSLEHVPDPIETLKAARERLAPGGVCLVRQPTTSSEAFSTYRSSWCLIDAPRHLVIPSRQGMSIAADAAGLTLEDVWDDSNSSQFYGSEIYSRNIALVEVNGLGHLLRMFGMRQMWHWERRSDHLNAIGRGDQAGFVLRHVT